MSDRRALRTRSQSHGRSGCSSPQMYEAYAEESFADGYIDGYQRGCFTDGQRRGYMDGLNARRMRKAQDDDDDEGEGDEESTDGESDDDEDDGESSKHKIMDKIWNLAEPGSELEKLVLEYDNASDEDNTDNESDHEETDEDDDAGDTDSQNDQDNKSKEKN